MTNRSGTDDGGGSIPTATVESRTRRPTRRGVLAAIGGGVLTTAALAAPATSSHAAPLVINDFENAFPGENALGEWSQVGEFVTSDVTDDAMLEVSYDGTGWFASNVRRSVTAYDRLELVIRGESGGEEADATLEVGGVEGPLAELADGTIGTEQSVLAVDLEAAGVDRSSVDDIWLEFFDSAGTIWIDELRFVAGGPPPIAGDRSPRDLDGDGTYEDIDGSGTVAFPDVNAFFQQSDTSAVTDHADAFDFTGDGTITLQDVMALFRRV